MVFKHSFHVELNIMPHVTSSDVHSNAAALLFACCQRCRLCPNVFFKRIKSFFPSEDILFIWCQMSHEHQKLPRETQNNS